MQNGFRGSELGLRAPEITSKAVRGAPEKCLQRPTSAEQQTALTPTRRLTKLKSPIAKDIPLTSDLQLLASGVL
eukprot:11862912-Alexandrium_andersonii.AAC.1